MDALLHRFHNFILPLVRGEDRVCACTCGRRKAYHVIPYHGAEAATDPRGDDLVRDIMSQQEMDVITGLLLGLGVGWLLLWLAGVWRSGRKHWRTSRLSDVGFWSQMLKLSSTKDLSRPLHPKRRGLEGGGGARPESCVS